MAVILVTGGAGFIGSNIVAALSQRGDQVIVVDRLEGGEKWRNLVKHPLLDIAGPDRLFEMLDRYGSDLAAVVHMGAISSTEERDLDLLVETNVALPQRLWRWCAERDVRFVYASSASTYGDGSRGFSDDLSQTPLATLRPLNAYGWSKHVFDGWMISRYPEEARGGPGWVGLKFFNVYGPNETHKGNQRSMVSHAFDQIAARGTVRLFKSIEPDIADGEQQRDFVWVDDCVNVVLWACDNARVRGLFNVGSGVERSFAALARAVFSSLGREPAIEFFDMPEHLRANYQSWTRADLGKLHGAGYNGGTTSLEEGVEAYVRGFLASGDPYR